MVLKKRTMWELMAANKRRSVYLLILMAVLLILLGYFIGAALFPPDGGIVGIIIAVGVWLFLSLTGFWGGGSIMLAASRAASREPSRLGRRVGQR